VGVATSIIVFAIGAILRFATTVSSTDFNIHTVGVILMIVGAVGFVVSLFFWASWGGFGGWNRSSRTVYRRTGDTAYPASGTSGDVIEEHHSRGY
jgi:hypothetical protein